MSKSIHIFLLVVSLYQSLSVAISFYHWHRYQCQKSLKHPKHSYDSHSLSKLFAELSVYSLISLVFRVLSFMNTFLICFHTFPFILVMKKKALNVNNVWLLLLSLLLFFIGDCICNTRLITSSNTESDSALNNLSSDPSFTSSSSDSSYEKYFYQTINGALPLDREVTVIVLSGESKRLVDSRH